MKKKTVREEKTIHEDTGYQETKKTTTEHTTERTDRPESDRKRTVVREERVDEHYSSEE